VCRRCWALQVLTPSDSPVSLLKLCYTFFFCLYNHILDWMFYHIFTCLAVGLLFPVSEFFILFRISGSLYEIILGYPLKVVYAVEIYWSSPSICISRIVSQCLFPGFRFTPCQAFFQIAVNPAIASLPGGFHSYGSALPSVIRASMLFKDFKIFRFFSSHSPLPNVLLIFQLFPNPFNLFLISGILSRLVQKLAQSRQCPICWRQGSFVGLKHLRRALSQHPGSYG